MKIPARQLYDDATADLFELADGYRPTNLVIVYGDDADGDHSRCWSFDGKAKGVPRATWRQMSDDQKLDRMLRVAAALHVILKEA